MPLAATIDLGHHHFATDTVYFYMNNGDQRVRCGITGLALELLEPELPQTKQGRIQAFNQRLRAAGKPFKVAITACMRKLLTLLNSLIRDNRHWSPQCPRPA